MMEPSKTARARRLWEGLLCLLFCFFSFAAMVPFLSNSPLTLRVCRVVPFQFFLAPPLLLALALGVVLLGGGRGSASGAARLLRRVGGVLCLLGAGALLLQLVAYKPLFRSVSTTLWHFLPLPHQHQLVAGVLPQCLWLLAALAAIGWMLCARPQLTRVGRVFWWGLLLGAVAYCVISLLTALVPLLTAADELAAKTAALRGTNRMRAMSGTWLVPLAFLLLYGYPAASGQGHAFEAPRGFTLWSILVVVANAATLLLLGWTTEFTGLLTLLLVMGVFLAYALLLTGQKKGFWLLLVLSVANAALGFVLTGPFALAGLLNPLICWLLLRKSWAELR